MVTSSPTMPRSIVDIEGVFEFHIVVSQIRAQSALSMFLYFCMNGFKEFDPFSSSPSIIMVILQGNEFSNFIIALQASIKVNS